jgi:hypothetical protein
LAATGLRRTRRFASSETRRIKISEIRPPLEFWRTGEAPVIESPWGETWRPATVRLLGVAIYNPYSFGPANSARFFEWQFRRATEAVYGQAMDYADYKRDRPRTPPADAPGAVGDPESLRLRVLGDAPVQSCFHRNALALPPGLRPGAHRDGLATHGADGVHISDRLAAELAHKCLYYMLLMREVEDRIERKLYRQGKIVGGVYVGRGQEAIPVGSALVAEPGDVLFPRTAIWPCSSSAASPRGASWPSTWGAWAASRAAATATCTWAT